MLTGRRDEPDVQHRRRRMLGIGGHDQELIEQARTIARDRRRHLERGQAPCGRSARTRRGRGVDRDVSEHAADCTAPRGAAAPATRAASAPALAPAPRIPVIPAIPPASTKPAAAAPISTSRWWTRSCPRQSVSLTTSVRSCSTAVPSSPRWASIDRRISSGERTGAGISRSTPLWIVSRILCLPRSPCPASAPDLELAPCEQTTPTVSSSSSTITIAKPEPDRVQQRVQTPGERQQREDQPEETEHGADDPRDRAATEARDLGRDLGLGELDLLSDEDRDLLGDLLDGDAQLGGLGFVSGQGA